MADEVRDRVQSILDGRKASLAAGPRTMADLAHALGTNRSTLHQCIAGTRALTLNGEGAVTIRRIAEALGVGIADIAGSGDGSGDGGA